MRNYYFALIALLFYLSGCSDSTPTEPILNSSINGQEITVAPNQKIKLDLDLCADAGYQWDYVLSNTGCLRLDSVSYRQKDGKEIIPGGMTVETFYFYSADKGQSTVTLLERQEWLKNVPPIDTVRFTVYVK